MLNEKSKTGSFSRPAFIFKQFKTCLQLPFFISAVPGMQTADFAFVVLFLYAERRVAAVQHCPSICAAGPL